MSRHDRFEPNHPQPQAGDAELIRSSVEALDASVEQLPPGLDSRLRAARREALERAGEAPREPQPWRLGLGAAASVVVIVGAVALLRPLLEAGPEPLPTLEHDAVQQLAAEHMDLLELLEFIAWLELQAGAGDAS